MHDANHNLKTTSDITSEQLMGDRPFFHHYPKRSGYLAPTDSHAPARSKLSSFIWTAIWVGLFIGVFLYSFTSLTRFLLVSVAITSLHIIHASLRLWACCAAPPTPIKSSHNAPINERKNWPKYSVLVPLYDEAQMVAGLYQYLAKLDYPKDRLEIFFICEADDHNTIDAVNTHLHAPLKLTKVPRLGPRTKPKTLNYALQYISGEYITIYDAENRPDPTQLKTAISAFETYPKRGALQAPLRFHNKDTNWLTRQFSLEYDSQFNIWLPFLVHLGWPLPLGAFAT